MLGSQPAFLVRLERTPHCLEGMTMDSPVSGSDLQLEPEAVQVLRPPCQQFGEPGNGIVLRTGIMEREKNWQNEAR